MARTGPHAPWPRRRMGQGRSVQALGGLVTTKLKRKRRQARGVASSYTWTAGSRSGGSDGRTREMGPEALATKRLPCADKRAGCTMGRSGGEVTWDVGVSALEGPRQEERPKREPWGHRAWSS